MITKKKQLWQTTFYHIENAPIECMRANLKYMKEEHKRISQFNFHADHPSSRYLNRLSILILILEETISGET